MSDRNSTAFTLLCLFVFAFVIRAYQLDQAPTQTDEQLWLARAYSLVHTIFNQKPDKTPITRIYSDNGNVDVFETGEALVAEQYPFTIRTEAHHPGVPPTLLIGLSYIFLGEGSHPASLNLLSPIAAMKLPQVIIGSLLVVVVYLGTNYLFNRRIALVAALMIAVSPLMIGDSRLARIDMTSAFFATCMFFSYVVLVNQISRRSQIKWALLAGIFAGLGMATNPYAVYIVPVFAFIKILLSHPTKTMWYQRFLPDRYDILFLICWIGVYVFAHPNLWANPIAGFGQWLDITLTQRKHLSGSGTHLLYTKVLLLSVLPSSLILALVGLIVGLRHQRKAIVVILMWFICFMLLLSIPSGRKNAKNILQPIIPIAICAGFAVDWLCYKLAQRMKLKSDRYVYGSIGVLIVLIGLGATAYWWPLPQLYVLPGIDISTEDEMAIASNGLKPALDYIYANSAIEPKRVIARSGRNILLLYLPEDAVGYGTLSDYRKSDWLIVLPKAADDQNDWYYGIEPSHIVKQHQIELAYLYYLPDFFPREMVDTSSPVVEYDNGILLYDASIELLDGKLLFRSVWGEKPEEAYGFSIQVFDKDNNKVAQGDYVLPVSAKQESELDLSALEQDSYRVALILYDLATAASVSGRSIESDSRFDRMVDVGMIDLAMSSSSDD